MSSTASRDPSETNWYGEPVASRENAAGGNASSSRQVRPCSAQRFRVKGEPMLHGEPPSYRLAQPVSLVSISKWLKWRLVPSKKKHKTFLESSGMTWPLGGLRIEPKSRSVGGVRSMARR